LETKSWVEVSNVKLMKTEISQRLSEKKCEQTTDIT